MSGSMPPREPSDGEGVHHERLMAAIEAVGAELRELRSSLTEEVRTRRVVLAEGDGFERLVAAARGGYAHVTLYGRTGGEPETCVELFANDPLDGTGAHVGVALTNRGEVVAVFETVHGGQSRLWIADDDRSPG